VLRIVMSASRPFAATPAAPPTVSVEVVSWVTKFVGGDGSGRRLFEEPLADGRTVRDVLAAVSARFPELAAALWNGREIGEHIEVLVNDAVLGVSHELDSPLRPGDRITLLGQYMGGR
jgi:molybdopterin converting factor small subunit